MKTILTTLVILATAALSIGPPVKAGILDDSKKISLELSDAPIATVVSMIARQQKLNLSLAGTISGRISVRLEDVPVRAALDAILIPNGYTYYVRDNILVVRAMSSDAESVGDLASQTVTLKYVDPKAAQKALESRKSSRGQIIVLEALQNTTSVKTGGASTSNFTPNRMVITDYPSVLTDLLKMVAEMDMPERMVSIAVKIIESSVDNHSKLGFLWPTQAGATLGSAGDSSTSGSGSGVYNPTTGSWNWSTLTVDQTRIVLDMLDQDGKAKLISDPHLTTVENHEAEIKIATVYPIPTINRFSESGSTTDLLTFQDQEVGISLKVTPRINDNGMITLDVFPKVEDIIGYVGTDQNQKPITSERSVRTRICVANGQTAALGGLLKDNDIRSSTKVPFFGSIPIFGKLLFTNSTTRKETSDLIILITPKIVE
ncbi:MAG: secretin and TonB N-terminal domain-containing protein [Candidatus Zixiibacteriota bacterium]